jgi:HAD superfamily hydrolase (TIGR01548 family)
VKATGFDALFLDMDGVLVDTRASFTAAVIMSARRFARPPGLAGDWGEAEVEALRLAGGFNNDWDAAAAVALLGPACGPGAQWAEFCSALRADGGGPEAVVIHSGWPAWESVRTAVTPFFQRLYAGPRAREAYGCEPTEPCGLFEREIPLVRVCEIVSFGLPTGILTGRTRGEAVLGLSRLGIELPSDRVLCHTEPRFQKPRPDGLMALAAATGAARPLYVGDTVDDLACALNARSQGLAVAFAGVAQEGSERERRFREGGAFLIAASLRTILDELSSEAGKRHPVQGKPR